MNSLRDVLSHCLDKGQHTGQWAKGQGGRSPTVRPSLPRGLVERLVLEYLDL